jgi:RimJ/RimL family protein N-acetyltransferase
VIRLGPISLISGPLMYAWRNNPEVYKWCRQYEPLELWTHEAWLSSLKDRTDVKMYGIFDGDHPIGVCGLTSLDLINRKAEFSIYVGEEHWGNGYGIKALKVLCAHGFMALGLNHIFGETFDGNPAIKTFEKVGFKKEGTRRQFYFREGKFIDAHLYSILSKEFLTKWKLSRS